jgi:hypothetical protein
MDAPAGTDPRSRGVTVDQPSATSNLTAATAVVVVVVLVVVDFSAREINERTVPTMQPGSPVSMTA